MLRDVYAATQQTSTQQQHKPICSNNTNQYAATQQTSNTTNQQHNKQYTNTFKKYPVFVSTSISPSSNLM